MQCVTCGCRMVATVGQRPRRLVCADCGRPVDEIRLRRQNGSKVTAAVVLLSLTALGLMLMFIVVAREISSGGPSPLQGAEAPAESE